MMINPELKDMRHNSLIEINQKLEKHTKEPVYIKDLKNLNGFKEIMTEAL
jgi:hypothetical protein